MANRTSRLAPVGVATVPFEARDVILVPGGSAFTAGGVARRMELKGERRGARIYDDYAHHPTEVRAALQAAREVAPGRLLVAFQPHLYSRTKALAADFGAALAEADEIAVLEVYPAREQPVGALEGVTGRSVAEAAAERAGGRTVWWLPDREGAARALSPRLGPGDTLVTIGAGDIFRLAEELVSDQASGHLATNGEEAGG